MNKDDRILYIMLIGVLVLAVGVGSLYQGIPSTFKGFLAIQVHPARLINDFAVVGGPGAALVNASIVAGIALLLIVINGVAISGPTIAAFFTLFGFGLFGKTPINIIPIIIGVAISAKIAKKSFKEYILIALFGTALGPIFSFIVFELGLTGPVALIVGSIGGIVAGIFLPPVAMAMLHLHQGYNLYNMGMTCGFVGVFVASLIAAGKGDLTIKVIWLDTPDMLLTLFTPVLSVYLMGFGVYMGKRKAFSDMMAIQKLPGRLPSDFMDMVSVGGALVNAGVLGIITWLYIVLVGGDLNGPVLGGILTVMGFGVFGKHVRNCIPVMLGVVLSCLVFGKSLTAPGPILAVLFSTTLAPLAGEFGAFTGIIAGFLHLIMVERTGAWHGGIDLYNNGFAGGLTAALIVSVIEWYRSSQPDEFDDTFN